MSYQCEHEVRIDTIQLELGIAIFICSWNETVSNKVKNEYGFVIRSARMYYPPVLWKPTCDQIEFPFKEDSSWQEFPAYSNDSSKESALESSY